ncbi:uncharacterized protein LOC107483718 [Arachis duranensis]|uniref:Uncharacterized protein LOC107483718 n=1 Tax=Arachis duranensis TaxID=130453 RepID=A0A6P4D5V3_ARADU|nr:uncharacterized protein LOC107483718 [Arachis duranensis]
MAEQLPPTLFELFQMVTELRQANQCMTEENQRMAQQIANLNNTRIKNNNDRQERTEEAEQQSELTHVFDTVGQKEEQPEHNEEARPDDENDNQESSPRPFTVEVMNFVLPRRFTMLTTLTLYDGLGDPKKYIKKFTSIMIVLFPNFETYQSPLRNTLLDRPSTYTGQHEGLREYMTRFTKIAMSIPDLHPEVELHAIKSGLRPEKFQKIIVVAKPKTMAEFREKAKEKPHYQDNDRTRDNKKNSKPASRYESYTQFNTKRDDIIKEILNSKLIKPPRKVSSYPDSKGMDRSKYCSFHQKHGHTTDEFVIAKDLLERLARQGHLDKYIGGHIQRRTNSSGEQNSATQHGRVKDLPDTSHPDKPRRIINYIFGGFAGGGTTSSARKRSYRAMLSIEANQTQQQTLSQFPQITFHTANHNTNVTNLNDLVIITLQLGDLQVKKVLLDLGSSADVLFYSTFQKIKLSSNILQPSTGETW